MSQLSKLSDIIPDVENFIAENDMTEDIGHLMKDGIPSSEDIVSDSEEEDETDHKVPPAESFGSSNYPQSSFVNKYPKYPPDQPISIGTEEYPGPFNFEVLIMSDEQKTPWQYSQRLRKLFIGIDIKFPVCFFVKPRPSNRPLYIRTTPFYSQTQYFQEPVHRCIGHQHPLDKTNLGLPSYLHHHIIRSTNEKCAYFGNKEEGNRLNLVLPLGLPQVGSPGLVREFFSFHCKNSCSLGMNRRPIGLVFTLEGEDGEVLGRRVVAVRVCSCPKRDREKEEGIGERRGKKRKVEKTDEDKVDCKIYPLRVNIVGKKNYHYILQACQNMMASEILRLKGRKDGSDVPFKKAYNEIETLIRMKDDLNF